MFCIFDMYFDINGI